MGRSISIVREKETTENKVYVFICIILVSFNLRPAITSVGPLMNAIREDMGISNGVAGFITTLPLLSFAIFSFIAPKLANHFGLERMIFIGLLVLLLGIFIRYISSLVTLFLGTALVGVGIAIANVLLPSMVKNEFPLKIGFITSVYTTCLSSFSAIGTGLSIPISEGLNVGWKNTLFIWGVLTILAIIFWIPIMKKKKSENESRKLGNDAGTFQTRSIWRSSLAWQVTLFMGLQSLIFFSMITWLPTLLHNNGVNLSLAGLIVSILQLSTLPMTFLTPILATKKRNQHWLVIMIMFMFTVGFVLFLFASHSVLYFICSSLIGLGLGASLSLALTLFGLRAANGQEAAQLSGMAHSFGYFLAALGPFIIGFVIDAATSTIIPFLFFLSIAFLQFLAGLGAARDRTVFQ